MKKQTKRRIWIVCMLIGIAGLVWLTIRLWPVPELALHPLQNAPISYTENVWADAQSFPGAGLPKWSVIAPDRAHAAYFTDLGSCRDYHRAVVRDMRSGDEVYLPMIQEADPCSGRSFTGHWSGDSRFFKVAGSAYAGVDFVLIYDVTDGRLYGNHDFAADTPKGFWSAYYAASR